MGRQDKPVWQTTPEHLDYPDCSMVDLVARAAARWPEQTAYTFMNRSVSYRTLMEQIDDCARALCALGVRPGDRVTLILPNVPQGVVLFYAVNRIGALSNMVHPLSSQEEIGFFLSQGESRVAVTLEEFWPKVSAAGRGTPLESLIVTGPADMLGAFIRGAYQISQGRKTPPYRGRPGILSWREFLAGGAHWQGQAAHTMQGQDPAAILYSGGTTGTMKGILLSNRNFNALGLQTAAAGDCIIPGHSMLSLMPIFHGFGLGVCIHTMLISGCRCILIPRFDAAAYAGLLKKHRPNYIAGVPTLFEALLRMKQAEGLDLSCLEGVFCGGDSLSTELKHKVDAFLTAHGADVQVREGYGTTECVTASCLTPKTYYREGSIGLPFADTQYSIQDPKTGQKLPAGEPGEICIAGPSVMLEYLNEPTETAQTLRRDDAGTQWLHTGDLGWMDEDGFVYFKQRLKRIIISSGYNIYPSQVENAIDAHPAVMMSTVIGVPDPYRMQVPKAFVMLRPGYAPTPALQQEILRLCGEKVAKYALPRKLEFRTELPKTRVGKVAYTVLEQEEAARQAVAEANKEG